MGKWGLDGILFGIGTWIGLYPLALIGTMSGRLSKAFQQSSANRALERQKKMQKNGSSENNPLKIPELEKDKTKESSKITLPPYSKIEFVSAFALIFVGIVFLILTLFQFLCLQLHLHLFLHLQFNYVILLEETVI